MQTDSDFTNVVAVNPSPIVITRADMPRIIIGGETINLKLFKQFELTDRLYAADTVYGYINYPNVLNPLKFLIIENSGAMWRLPYTTGVQFVSWEDKTNEEFVAITGMTKREHQDQYRLWRDKVGKAPRQLFI